MKTLFKLSAVSAVAIALTACGGGGGGGSSIANTPGQTDWSVGNADKVTVTPYAAPSSIYGAGTDLEKAHADGWRGQGIAIITGTTNNPVNVGAFSGWVQSSAPLASVYNAGNTNSVSTGGNYVAIGTTIDAATKLSNGTYTYVNGVAVVGSTSSSQIFVASGSADKNGNITNVTASTAFTKINYGNGTTLDTNGAGVNVGYGTAYLAGSAAIIGSKFNNLTHTEIVKNMDQSRDNAGAFSLSRALAPKGNLR